MQPGVGVHPGGFLVFPRDYVHSRLRDERLPVRRLLDYAAGAEPSGVHGVTHRRVSYRRLVRAAQPSSDAGEHGGLHEERCHSTRARRVLLHVSDYVFMYDRAIYFFIFLCF